MDESIFDSLTRRFAHGASRRAVLSLVGSLLAATGAGLAPSVARKKKKKKKSTFCRDGQTIKASKKKKAKLLASGATKGPCPPRSSPPSSPPSPSSPPPAPPSSPPPSPSECTPPCPAGSVCNNGVCEACDVVCTGSGVDCGVALQAKLDLGGTVRVCPGRYIGTFSFSATSTEVIGAGDGRDQASNTILDADEAGRVVTVPQDVAVTLRGVRMTGGSLPTGVGGGIRTAGTLSLVSCTIRGNVASQGGGIYHSGTATGPLELTNCQVTGNSTTTGSGGGIYGSGSQPVVLRGCAISGNRSGEFGGGIAKAGGSWIIAGSAIDANEAAEFGGGIYNSGPLTFDSASSITNNTADTAGTGAVGGGIYNSTGAVELNGAIVSGNEPDQCAGGGAVPGCPA